ncbi:hypothetical protein KY284_021018 [Solanum tuberosum]|nr:hypothetical protein KY284_021018 [Solanum tuberosum]
MVLEQEDSSSINNTGVSPSLQGIGSSSMDPSNPFYLHPSDSPRMSLVNSKFKGRGYADWKRSILIAL